MNDPTASPTLSADAVRQAWQQLQEAQPHLRIRDAAAQLNLSEVQLLATTVGPNCVRLRGPWPDFLKRLPAWVT